MRMMSCRKGIGWEGGAMEAREDSRQAAPRSERKGRVRGVGEKEPDCGNLALPRSHAIIHFTRCSLQRDSKQKLKLLLNSSQC